MRDEGKESLLKWFTQLAITCGGFILACVALAAETPAGFFVAIAITAALVALIPNAPARPMQGAVVLSDQQKAGQRLRR